MRRDGSRLRADPSPGTKKTFSDREWLKPYLAMFEAEWERRAVEQRAAEQRAA
jgi:hypothetical protein